MADLHPGLLQDGSYFTGHYVVHVRGIEWHLIALIVGREGGREGEGGRVNTPGFNILYLYYMYKIGVFSSSYKSVWSTHWQQFKSSQQRSSILVVPGDGEPVEARSGGVHQRQPHHRLGLSAADELITSLGGEGYSVLFIYMYMYVYLYNASL